MGDTGSLLIGLINSILVIKFINTAASPGISFPLEAAPALGFAILIVPLFDTLRVFALRILSRRSPFSPDRTHVHHFLLEFGYSHKKITILCVSFNLLLILLAFSLRSLGTTTVIGILLVASFSFIGIIYYSRPKNKEAKIPNAQIPEPLTSQLTKSHKILSILSKSVEAS